MPAVKAQNDERDGGRFQLVGCKNGEMMNEKGEKVEDCVYHLQHPMLQCTYLPCKSIFIFYRLLIEKLVKSKIRIGFSMHLIKRNNFCCCRSQRV